MIATIEGGTLNYDPAKPGNDKTVFYFWNNDGKIEIPPQRNRREKRAAAAMARGKKKR